MKTFKNYILKETILSLYDEYWKTHDFDKWLFETYEDVNNISEELFYNDKYQYEFLDWSKPHYNIWLECIYERLGESFELTEKNCEPIKNFKGIVEFKIINKKNYKFQIKVDDTFDEKEFSTLMNFYNYAKDIRTKDNYILYEATTPKEINENFDYVYHVTNKLAYEKIKTVGLIPKLKYNHNLDWKHDKSAIEYPGRIYCFGPDTDIYRMKSFGKLTNVIHKRNINDIIILKIDLKKFSNQSEKSRGNVNIKFYGDPAYNLNTAMFTLEPIPSKFINIYDNEE